MTPEEEYWARNIEPLLQHRTKVREARIREQAVIDAARAVKESDEHGAVAWDDVIQDLIDAVRALDGGDQ